MSKASLRDRMILHENVHKDIFGHPALHDFVTKMFTPRKDILDQIIMRYMANSFDDIIKDRGKYIDDDLFEATIGEIINNLMDSSISIHKKKEILRRLLNE